MVAIAVVGGIAVVDVADNVVAVEVILGDVLGIDDVIVLVI